jgi:hypothetical protein
MRHEDNWCASTGRILYLRHSLSTPYGMTNSVLDVRSRRLEVVTLSLFSTRLVPMYSYVNFALRVPTYVHEPSTDLDSALETVTLSSPCATNKS